MKVSLHATKGLRSCTIPDADGFEQNAKLKHLPFE
jgi:hypothetical protein